MIIDFIIITVYKLNASVKLRYLGAVLTLRQGSRSKAPGQKRPGQKPPDNNPAV